MKGANTLRINQATMNEAMEFYLNSEVFKDTSSVVVSGVSYSVQSGNDREFIVSFSRTENTP